MKEIEILNKLIEENRPEVNFPKKGEGVPSYWILKAEDRLGLKFSPSYIWWLENYGVGEIFGEEIFGIYQKDFDIVVGGDIVYQYEIRKKNGLYEAYELIVCEQEDYYFYFDLRTKDQNGEYQLKEGYSNVKYADNFYDFLIKRIKQYDSK